ncbi:hypothetical protein OIU79_016902 [Salix purpurea]|uniref:Uncharacterized protein n=1 Tax=Salix purpurea TaxID=77065 RepID=A0A9Q0SS23_SALPP|nr:hypothetical protein OIU79_016902 [Salix purpurea]
MASFSIRNSPAHSIVKHSQFVGSVGKKNNGYQTKMGIVQYSQFEVINRKASMITRDNINFAIF